MVEVTSSKQKEEVLDESDDAKAKGEKREKRKGNFSCNFSQFIQVFCLILFPFPLEYIC